MRTFVRSPHDAKLRDGLGMRVAIVSLAFLGNFLMATFATSLNVLVHPLATSFQVPPNDILLMGSLAAMAMAMGALPTGFLLDHFAVHMVMAGAATLMAAGYAMLALSDSLTMFGTVAILAISIPATAIGVASATKLILGRFAAGSGTLLAIAFGGVAAAGITLPLFVAWFSELAGWRQTFAVFSLFSALLVIPVLVFGPRTRSEQQPKPREPLGAAMSLIKQRSFWIIVVSIGLANGFATAAGLLAVGHVTRLPLSLVDASMVFSVASLAGLIGLPIWGALFDRFNPVHLLTAALAGCGCALSVFAYTDHYAMMLASFGLFGFGMVAVNFGHSVLLKLVFGVDLLGRAYGATALAMIPFVGLPTAMASRMSELGGTMQYSGMGFGYMVIAVLLLALRKAKAKSCPEIIHNHDNDK